MKRQTYPTWMTGAAILIVASIVTIAGLGCRQAETNVSPSIFQSKGYGFPQVPGGSASSTFGGPDVNGSSTFSNGAPTSTNYSGFGGGSMGSGMGGSDTLPYQTSTPHSSHGGF